jgi:hypothetical protein
MNQREKIIVGIMLLTVVYGVYVLFFEGKVKGNTLQTATESSAVQLKNLNAFITKVAEASKGGLSKKDQYIISRAETQWKQDPLITVELTDRPRAEINQQKQVIQKTGPRPNLTYTGFMQMGEKKFAIINGFEYAPGDELQDGGYTVNRITPTEVVIVSTDKSKKKYIYPLEE